MKDIRWLINRLKAMSLSEVIWRVKEKNVQKKENNWIYAMEKPVTDIPLPSDLLCLHIDISKISINWDNRKWTAFKELDLFGIFEYEKYKYKWNAGFQTENTWPEIPFSPTIRLSQRIDIGDIRTNWELNRHFQFAALAKSFYCTKESKYLIELENLFHDWNAHNLFLHGVEWSSAMELAIRVNSWIYMFCFLKKAGYDGDMLFQIEHGILVMVDYISRHRSRFSSANNHLIVEMYAVALTGILTEYKPWRDDALRVLTEELRKQNYADGVNKEMSLHYQSFVMEAYGLLWILMMRNHIGIPEIWKSYLTLMAEFVSDATDKSGNTMEFGDNDEGKILDLNGQLKNYYQYVLNLMGCILDRRYIDADWHENLNWVVPEELKIHKEKYIPDLVCCREEGGYTFLRSTDRRILIGIDHAALGFGCIAAHGHADALSFQMFVDGEPVFIDPGTYLYHCGIESRNAIRSTKNHNTVSIDDKDQSEMLGTFLWGKKAEARLIEAKEDSSGYTMTASHDGYAPVEHTRTLKFDGDRKIEIIDMLSPHADKAAAFFWFSPYFDLSVENECVMFDKDVAHGILRFLGQNTIELINGKYSSGYGREENIIGIRISFQGDCLRSYIEIAI